MRYVLPRHEVVLLGVGHTNAHVLRMWRMQPIPAARLTCVSNFSVVTYSGMLPGVLAGQYPQERMEIDLVRLCASAGARLIVEDATGLDLEQRRLEFANRPPLPFDVLSIGIGSTPSREGVQIEGDAVLPIKPMQTFLPRLERRLRELHEKRGREPLRVAVVGGGVGGVEITLCLPARVKKLLGDRPLELRLVSAHSEVAGGVSPRTVDRVRRMLERRGVTLALERRVVRTSDMSITLDDGQEVQADLVLWATSAVAPPLLKNLGLPTDGDGFLLTHETLESIAAEGVFAVGDSGTIQNLSLPKAGVYAVREGPVLWENIRRKLEKQPLLPYEPQRGFMKLLNTGDGRAIGDWKGHSFSGRWAWTLKDWIDGRFMDKYQDYHPMEMNGQAAASNGAIEPRCTGCGGKVGSAVLARVLRRLDIPPSEYVLLGLATPDDAAIVQFPGGRPMVVTTDFFAAPLDDAYAAGRIAALNAASDAFTFGARPVAALAIATIPVGDTHRQEELLYDLLAGGLEEFRRMGATLVGGHTIEGPQLTIGYTVLADPGDRPARARSGLREGDGLILTKPLGTGVLLAAHMRAQCRAAWLDELLRTMLVSNQAAAALIDDFDISAATDVTGFGLAGHALQLAGGAARASVEASARRAAVQGSDVRSQESEIRGATRHSPLATLEIALPSIPLLPGAAELLSTGIESTLAPSNRAAETAIESTEPQRRAPQYAAMFDPQTSGGLLLAVAESDVEGVLRRLSEQSDLPAAVIGRVVSSGSQTCPIRLVDSSVLLQPELCSR